MWRDLGDEPANEMLKEQPGRGTRRKWSPGSQERRVLSQGVIHCFKCCPTVKAND